MSNISLMPGSILNLCNATLARTMASKSLAFEILFSIFPLSSPNCKSGLKIESTRYWCDRIFGFLGGAQAGRVGTRCACAGSPKQQARQPKRPVWGGFVVL